MNPPTVKYCGGCGMVVDQSTALMPEQEKKIKKQALLEFMQNP